MRVVVAGDFPSDPAKVSGGVEAVVAYLVRALHQYKDLHLSVITLSGSQRVRRTATYGGVNIYYLPVSRLPSYFSNLSNTRRIRNEMVRLRPHVIHVQVAGEFAQAASNTGIPWVLTLHGIRYLEERLRKNIIARLYRGCFISMIERGAIRRAKHVICINPFVQSAFRGLIRGRIHDIENPIDDAFFEIKSTPVRNRLLFAGSLIPRKRVMSLLQAFVYVKKRMPDATLRLAGGVPHYDSGAFAMRLRRFVADSGLDDSVKFLGALGISEMLMEYAQCVAVVLPSVLETAPMTIMEAMAAGKPVVSTNVGGVGHIVEDGRSGLLVSPNDALALGDTLHRLLADETRLITMGRQARKIAEKRFRARFIAARTREVYYHILGPTTPE